jgi:soluble lytic murein transglycosylase-like protein
MSRVAAFLLLLVAAAISPAQTLQEYLELRKKHGVTQAVSVAALETLIGSRVLEVQGVVKGSIRMGSTVTLMVEQTDGDTMAIQGASVPDWLQGNEVHARLLVKAERPTEMAHLAVRLLGAAPESGIARVEAEERRRLEQAAAAAAKRSGASVSSRSAPPPRAPAKEWNLPAHEATPYYAAFIKQRNKRLTDSEAYRIASGIIGFSLRYGVDARLIMAMVMVESGFNPNATSRAGAMGLGQLMPGTAKWMGVNNAYDTTENLFGTVKLIRGHLEKYTRQAGAEYDGLVLALAAYNAGSGAVKRHGGVPPYRETQNYVRKVISIYKQLSGQS